MAFTVSKIKSKIYQSAKSELLDKGIDISSPENTVFRELLQDIIWTSIHAGRAMMAESLKGIVNSKLRDVAYDLQD